MAQVCRALGNLCYGTEFAHIKKSIMEANAVTAILATMRSNSKNASTQRWECHTLSSLSYGNTPNSQQDAMLVE